MRDASTPEVAFAAREEPAQRAQVAVHVNFGVFTGREATLAEIDRLAATLLDRAFTIYDTLQEALAEPPPAPLASPQS